MCLFGTSSGTVASAMIYSLLETMNANNLRLDDYVFYPLIIFADRFVKSPHAAINNLFFWSRQMRVQFDIWFVSKFTISA